MFGKGDNGLFYNPYLVIPITAWIIAQTIKVSISAFRGQVDFKYLYASGGMPSGHSAVVCALATTALLLDGAASHLFGLTVVLAAIVMYDSFGVRRASGEQAAALNMVIESLDLDKIRLRDPKLKLREILGHKPLEVTMGALLGILMAIIFNLSKVSAQLAWLSALPSRQEAIGYAIGFGLVLVVGIITRFILARRYPKSKVIKVISRRVLVLSQVIAWPGLLFALAEYESLAYFSWRVWPLVVSFGAIVWAVYLAKRYWNYLPSALQAEREVERKGKWLAGRKRKKGRK